MLEKLSVKALAIIFVLLLVLSAVTYFSESNTQSSSLPPSLVLADSSQIDAIEISPKGGTTYQLKLQGGQWMLQLPNGKVVPTKDNSVQQAFAELLQLEPQKRVSANPDKHASFEVSDSLATKLRLKKGEEVLQELYVGKFSIGKMPQQNPQMQQMGKQQQPEFNSYVRYADEEDVYQVEGGLSWKWNKKAEDWRNKTVVDISKFSLQSVQVGGSMQMRMQKDTTDQWQVEGIMLDSSGTQQYLDKLTSFKVSAFYDDIDPSQLANPTLTLSLEAKDGKSNVINVYQYQGKNLLTSSINQLNVFELSDAEMEKLLPATNTPVEDMEDVAEMP